MIRVFVVRNFGSVNSSKQKLVRINSSLLEFQLLSRTQCYNKIFGNKVFPNSLIFTQTFRTLSYLANMSNESNSINNGTDFENYIENNIYKDGELIQKVMDITIKENLYKMADAKQKIIEFLHPNELQKALPLKFNREGCESVNEIEDIIEKVVKYSVKTTHPHYYNQLYGGIDEVGLMSSWLLEALNTNLHTYEVAPAFIIIEKFMVNQLVHMFGWDDGDGLFAPGGSMSNMYGLQLARHNKIPQLKESGLFGQKELVIFTSDMGHYSITKAAIWMGFGTNQVISVETDAHGRMRANFLLAAIHKVENEGRQPFMVNATSGTTVFGAFDPLEEISEVCREKNLWLHVDACWGGSVIMSDRYKFLLKGIERADSIAWNPHKMMCAPLQCSAFLVKNKHLLKECLSVSASYLFQPDKLYDVSYDMGDKSVQCGRKADSMKLWIMFKVHGLEKLGSRVDAAFDVAWYLEKEIKKRSSFRLVLEERDFTNVCFWYIPPSFQILPENEEWFLKLHKVAAIIKGRMTQAGTMLVGYQPVESKNLVNFFRMVITTYPISTKEHMNFVLDEIESRGKDLQYHNL